MFLKVLYRAELYNNWASMRKFFWPQPLHDICHYFGEDTATYFAFIAYYTKFLGIYSIIGIIVFLYGIISESDYVEKICSMNSTMTPFFNRVGTFVLKFGP